MSNNKEGSEFFLKSVGLLVFGCAVMKVSYQIYNNIATFFFGAGSINFKDYGEWAGCTDGIGKAYTDQLAKQGLNIVLISRNLKKLENQSIELEEKYEKSIKTLVIVADFREPNFIYGEIQNKIKDLDIAVLVNNVGMSYFYPEYYHIFSQSNQLVTDFINCNITSVAKMTAIILPSMVTKNKGIIINNACFTGRIPIPFLSAYSASKAYIDSFSKSLALEYKDTGIIVQSLCPYFVSTKLTRLRSSITVSEPKEFVEEALKTIKTQKETNGSLIHNIQGLLYEKLLPRFIFYNISRKVLLTTRSAALKKYENNSKKQMSFN